MHLAFAIRRRNTSYKKKRKKHSIRSEVLIPDSIEGPGGGHSLSEPSSFPSEWGGTILQVPQGGENYLRRCL